MPVRRSIAESGDLLFASPDWISTAFSLSGGVAGGVFGIGEMLRFLAFAMAGNLIGGSLFVAGLDYAHIRQSRVDG